MNRLLIVDDDPDTLLIVSEIARIAGHAPSMASNFIDAREILKHGVSAVLLDIVMPDQLCIRLSAYMAEECVDTPVILMTSGSQDFVDKVRSQLGVIGLTVAGTLTKPFWVDGLLEVLSHAITPSADADAPEPEALMSSHRVGD